MRRYFLDLFVDGTLEPDKDGVLFLDDATVREEAVAIAADIAREPEEDLPREIEVRVRGEDGQQICVVRMSTDIGLL